MAWLAAVASCVAARPSAELPKRVLLIWQGLDGGGGRGREAPAGAGGGGGGGFGGAAGRRRRLAGGQFEAGVPRGRAEAAPAAP